MIDVLTLNYNDAKTTIQFVDSVKNYGIVGHIVVVDNNSTDDSIELLKKIECEKVSIVRSDRNGGYGAGNNLGIQYLHQHFDSKMILLANPDVIVQESVLKRLESFLESHSDYAFVAPMMKNPKGVVQYNSAMKIPGKFSYIASLDLIFSKLLKPFYYRNFNSSSKPVLNVDAVAGSLFLMNAETMLKYGMFDEDIFLYCEECVLGIKMRTAGVKTALLTDVDYIHNHSVSIKKTFSSLIARNKLMMKSRLYVLKTYYKAGFFSYLVAKVLSKMCLLEARLIGLLNKYR